MQVHRSEFRSVFTCAHVVYRNEGLSAFYVSYPTTLMMTIPFTAVQFTVYEQMKRLLNPSGSYSPVTHIIAGGVAGGVAAGVTTPLDVAKTILQTRGTSHETEIRSARGMADAFRIIWRRDGMRGFTRGLAPRVLTFMPSNALCWLSYEFFSGCRFFSSIMLLLTNCSRRSGHSRVAIAKDYHPVTAAQAKVLISNWRPTMSYRICFLYLLLCTV
jgi:solute carrier family 25 iron transporter 28/37